MTYKCGCALKDIANPMRSSLFKIMACIKTYCFPGRKGETVITIRKGILCNHADCLPLLK
jgi:hypothetical protein